MVKNEDLRKDMLAKGGIDEQMRALKTAGTKAVRISKQHTRYQRDILRPAILLKMPFRKMKA